MAFHGERYVVVAEFTPIRFCAQRVGGDYLARMAIAALCVATKSRLTICYGRRHGGLLGRSWRSCVGVGAGRFGLCRALCAMGIFGCCGNGAVRLNAIYYCRFELVY